MSPLARIIRWLWIELHGCASASVRPECAAHGGEHVAENGDEVGARHGAAALSVEAVEAELCGNAALRVRVHRSSRQS
eukprot:6176439-Pleurochrysis_carterae.AAC.1